MKRAAPHTLTTIVLQTMGDFCTQSWALSPHRRNFDTFLLPLQEKLKFLFSCRVVVLASYCSYVVISSQTIYYVYCEDNGYNHTSCKVSRLPSTLLPLVVVLMAIEI